MSTLPNQTPFFLSSRSICNWLKDMLAHAISDPRHSWHQGPVSYLDASGHPITKTIVWREWEPTIASLCFYTDIRSVKWSALKKNPSASLLLYCNIHQVQFSAQVRASLSSGCSEDKERFFLLSEAQKSAYQSVETPGTLFEGQDTPTQKIINANLNGTYFGRVHIKLESFDFVSLHPDGHQRLIGPSILSPNLAKWVCP